MFICGIFYLEFYVRRLFLLFIIVSLVFCSCEERGKIFDYQDAGGVYEGEISYLGETFSAVITLAPLVQGERESVQIEYLTPESVAGYRVKRQGDKYYAIVSDLEIPVTSVSLPQLGYTDALFALRDEDVSDATPDADGNTVVKVSCGEFGADAVAVFNSEGRILSLSLPGVDFSITFKAG